jgi:hypothetical protein
MHLRSRVKFVKYAGGTMFGGRKETVIAWAKAFYAVFLRYSRKNFHHLKYAILYFLGSHLQVQKEGTFPGKGPECDGHHMSGDPALSYHQWQVKSNVPQVLTLS